MKNGIGIVIAIACVLSIAVPLFTSIEGGCVEFVKTLRDFAVPLWLTVLSGFWLNHRIKSKSAESLRRRIAKREEDLTNESIASSSEAINLRREIGEWQADLSTAEGHAQGFRVAETGAFILGALVGLLSLVVWVLEQFQR